MEMPLVSIVIPIWNSENFLPRCLDSVRAQTYQNFECILVEDGSPDGCGAICDRYAARDSRFRAVHKENGGVSSARNAGLELVNGRYVFFVDSDDAIEEHLVEYAMKAQLAQPDRLIMWDLTLSWEELGKKAGLPYEEKLMRGLEVEMMFNSKGQGVQVWNKLFQMDTIRSRQMVFDPELGYVHNLSEDADFFQRYRQAFFEGREPVYVYLPVPRYYHEMDNPNSLVTRYEAEHGAFERKKEGAQAGYAARILEEYRQSRKGYEELFRDDEMGFVTVRHYLRCFAYAAWCARQLGESLPPHFIKGPEVREMLAFCKAHRHYSPYYLPFRLGSAGFVAQMYQWDNENDINFHRVVAVEKRLLGGRW